MNRARTLALALVLAGTLCAPAANALVGGTIDPNTSTEWSGVVSITTIGGGVYSGALIDRTHVLTAAHVAAGFVNNPGDLKINVNFGGDLTQQITASQIFVHPDFQTGRVIGNGGVWNDDIAVIRLSAPAAAGVTVYSLFDATLGLALNGLPLLNGAPVNVKMVAYGAYADGVSPAAQAGGNAAVKRVGENRLEALYGADAETPGATPPAGVAEGFLFDFDAGIAGEASYAGGDSGSPVFVFYQNQWRIIGVGAFNGTPPNVETNSIQFGAIGGGMLVSPYTGWIQAQMAAPVPEPQTHALMLAGLGLVAAAARYRRRSACARSIR